MRRIALTLVALPLLFAGSSAMPGSVSAQISLPPPLKCDTIQMEPLVNVETSGYGLAGPIHHRFTVFNNGLVSMSRMEFGGDGKADFIVIPETGVKEFVTAMVDAGAFKLCDQDMIVADAPPTTVTMFRGRMDAKTHTFTYWAAFDQHAEVGQAIFDFQNKWFPEF
jgi:hypothetical protein